MAPRLPADRHQWFLRIESPRKDCLSIQSKLGKRHLYDRRESARMDSIRLAQGVRSFFEGSVSAYQPLFVWRRLRPLANIMPDIPDLSTTITLCGDSASSLPPAVPFLGRICRRQGLLVNKCAVYAIESPFFQKRWLRNAGRGMIGLERYSCPQSPGKPRPENTKPKNTLKSYCSYTGSNCWSMISPVNRSIATCSHNVFPPPPQTCRFPKPGRIAAACATVGSKGSKFWFERHRPRREWSLSLAFTG